MKAMTKNNYSRMVILMMMIIVLVMMTSLLSLYDCEDDFENDDDDDENQPRSHGLSSLPPLSFREETPWERSWMTRTTKMKIRMIMWCGFVIVC